jgi:hypothetical protein
MKFAQLPINGVQRSLFPILSVTVPLLIYTALIIIGPQEIGLAARYDLTNGLIPVIALIVLLYPAYRLSGWTGTLASLSLTLILFALPLLALWNSGDSFDGAMGGLLPSTDASGYYWDARRVLEGDTFSTFSSRRPLFPGMLAALLGLTQQNLQVTLAVLVAINAISCFFLAREIQRTHGTVTGLLVITILFLFYRGYAGIVFTENLGLAMGAVGFALLWRGASQRRVNHCLLGLFLLTLALNARAGAFFILPALILWGTWSFRGMARFSWRFLLGGASVVLLGFIANSIVLKVVGSPEGIAFSNFSYSLYGLIVGGNWTQVLIDHPELENLSDPELSERIYALAFEALRANPLGLVTGSLRAWNQFLFNDYVFSFTRGTKVNFLLQFLSILGLFFCFRQRREAEALLIIASTIGIFASVPFVPPWDVPEMRPYAATIPVFVILPALGLAFLAKVMDWQQLVRLTLKETPSQLLVIFSTIFALFVCIAPITTKIFSRAPQFTDIVCPAGTEAIYVRISPGSSINLVDDNSIQQTRVPNIKISDFKKGLEGFDTPAIAQEYNSINASSSLINTFNLKDKKPILLINKSSQMPKESGIFGVCGNLTANPEAKIYGFFYAESLKKLVVN